MMSCDRLWEIDAVREGRLLGADVASNVRHRATCAMCRMRFAADQRLAILAAGMLFPEIEPLRARRLRARVLRERAQASPARRPWRFALAVVVVAATASAAVVLRPTSPPPPLAPSPVRVVESVRTAPPPPPPQKAPEMSAPAISVAPTPKLDLRDPVADEYAEAVHAYRAHDYDEAATKLARFSAAHPHARQNEDAMFLNASALAFAGRVDEAGTAADRFLALYPSSIHARDAAILVARSARKHAGE